MIALAGSPLAPVLYTSLALPDPDTQRETMQLEHRDDDADAEPASPTPFACFMP